jgi:acyl dehydratase
MEDPKPFAVPEITRERMLEVMDIMGDTNPIHSDEELVARLGYRGLVNQGPANLSYVMRMLLEWAGDPAAIRDLRFRFHQNVVSGDHPVARATVTGSRPGDGEELVELAFRLELDDGSPALTGVATIGRPHAR